MRVRRQQLHSVSKASIRSYCDESHDIASAKNMHTALEERRTSQGNGSVSAHMRIVQEQNSTLEMNKIANLNSLHNFEFTQEGLRVWRAFNVGAKMFIPWNNIVICLWKKKALEEEIQFFPAQARWCVSVGGSKSDCDGNSDSCYQCTEPGCNEDFTTQADLDLHMNLLDHHASPVHAKVTESLYDKWGWSGFITFSPCH